VRRIRAAQSVSAVAAVQQDATALVSQELKAFHLCLTDIASLTTSVTLQNAAATENCLHQFFTNVCNLALLSSSLLFLSAHFDEILFLAQQVVS
jgi:hypothetical protein